MIIPALPERIKRLGELANNLWWSWHPEARQVFRALDYTQWRLNVHNPVKLLREVSHDKLEAAADDPAFLELYDLAISSYDAEMSSHGSWFNGYDGELLKGPIAYFSMEYAIHASLPIYAGGLGVLAGDLCKEASDLGLPMVAVGFMYPQGYFLQHISPEGWQEEQYQELNFSEAPITPIYNEEGGKSMAQVQLGNRILHIGVWQVNVGRVRLYLLDTNIAENAPDDRELSNRLYTADREHRLQQEILLGIGGVRVLRSLGIQPSIWHANEGHTSFMMAERVREEMNNGLDFDEAVEKVKVSTVFTTHTPLPAGHDVFPVDLIECYFWDYWRYHGIEREQFLELGRQCGTEQIFNMTTLALKTASHCNAVSRLHGRVARRMWYGLWADSDENEVPITHVTNGIHLPTWIAPELRNLYQKYLGPDLIKRQDSAEYWQQIDRIPDEELWHIRHILKRKLMHVIMERSQLRWGNSDVPAAKILAMGALLDHDALTIGYVRRFTEYKRPGLIFSDMERIKRIITDSWRPVQLIIAGKCHPADFNSKNLLHQIYNLATVREFQGRVAFVEDYDMHIAHYLVQGVDVWLNAPRRLQEACGTSGMKAALNGVLHLSVPDGWWHEAFNGANGWSIGDEKVAANHHEEDERDATALYNLLEREIVPLYYNQDRTGVPRGWAAMMKEAIRSIVPLFCARRMMKDYCKQMYLPAVTGTPAPV